MTLGPAMLRQLERNAPAKQALAEEFRLLSSVEVARRAGSSATNAAALASRWRGLGQIFAVDVEGSARFTGFQFDADGRPLLVIADVVAALGSTFTGWDLALWFTGGSGSLEEVRPVDAMTGKSEDVEAVVETARAVKESSVVSGAVPEPCDLRQPRQERSCPLTSHEVLVGLALREFQRRADLGRGRPVQGEDGQVPGHLHRAQPAAGDACS